MAKRSAIPQNNREYPEYEYRKFPLFVGVDEHGAALIARSEGDVAELEAQKVYPLELGLNKHGKPVIVNHPNELKIKKAQVVTFHSAKKDEPEKKADEPKDLGTDKAPKKDAKK